MIFYHKMNAVMGARDQPDKNLILFELLLILWVSHSKCGSCVLPALQIGTFTFLLKLGANNRNFITFHIVLESVNKSLIALSQLFKGKIKSRVLKIDGVLDIADEHGEVLFETKHNFSLAYLDYELK